MNEGDRRFGSKKGAYLHLWLAIYNAYHCTPTACYEISMHLHAHYSLPSPSRLPPTSPPSLSLFHT